MSLVRHSSLAMVIGGIIFALGLEVMLKKIMQESPEMRQTTRSGLFF